MMTVFTNARGGYINALLAMLYRVSEGGGGPPSLEVRTKVFVPTQKGYRNEITLNVHTVYVQVYTQ